MDKLPGRAWLAGALLAAGLAADAGAATFRDDLDAQNSSLWTKSVGSNGAMFNVGWRTDHVTFNNGVMTLRLDNAPSGGTPYSAGEYRSNVKHGYGRLEARMKAVRSSGVITSLFTYTGPKMGDPWDEIDIEIFGKDPTKMQCNYFAGGIGGHETVVDLGFDSSADFHTYAFEWSADSIKWLVKQKDDTWLEVCKETGARGPLPTHPGTIITNMWASRGVDGWTGRFTYQKPLFAQYDYIIFTPERSSPAEPTGKTIGIAQDKTAAAGRRRTSAREQQQ